MKDLVIPARLQRYFHDYSQYHRSRGNQVTHSVGIPMIAVALLGLLAGVQLLSVPPALEPLLRLDAGLILWSLALVWYVFLDWRIAFPFGLFALGLYFLGRALPVPGLWGLFAAGWALQFVGHYHYEKKAPAFLTNVMHFLIGPLWVFARWVGYVERHSG